MFPMGEPCPVAAPAVVAVAVYARTLAAYVHAYERVLGLPSGSLHLVEEDTLYTWFTL